MIIVYRRVLIALPRAITKSEMQVREEVEKEKKTPVERGAAGKDAGHGEGATEIKEANDAQDGVGVTG